MKTVTVEIPDELHANMGRFLMDKSWSKLACGAFHIAIGEIIQRKGSKSFDEVVMRLRGNKLLHELNKAWEQALKASYKRKPKK